MQALFFCWYKLHLRLLLTTEAPTMTPAGVEFSFLVLSASYMLCYAACILTMAAADAGASQCS